VKKKKELEIFLILHFGELLLLYYAKIISDEHRLPALENIRGTLMDFIQF